MSLDTTATHERPPTGAPLFPAVIKAANRIARVACETPERDAVLRAVGDGFRESVGVSRCSIFLPGGNANDVNLYRGVLFAGKADYTPRVLSMTNGQASYALEILERRAPVIITHSRADPRIGPELATSNEFEAHSMLGLPVTLGDEVLALIFLDDGNLRARYSPTQVGAAAQLGALCGASLRYAEAMRDERHSLRQTREENSTLRRLFKLGEWLEQLVVGGVSITDFAMRTARMIGRSVTLYDSAWRVVAHSLPDDAEERYAVDLGSPRVRSHPRIRPELERVARGEIRTIAALPALGIHRRCIVAPIPLGPSNWGQIVLHETRAPFRSFDAQVLGRIGAKLGSTLATSYRGAATPGEIRVAVVSDLLRGEEDLRSIRLRAEGAGIPVGTDHLLVLFAAPPPATVTATMRDRMRHIVERATGSSITMVDVGDIVVALAQAPAHANGPGHGSAEGCALRKAIAAGLATDPALTDISAVISASFAELTDCYDVYTETQQAIRCMQRFWHARLPRAVHISEFGAALPFIASIDIDAGRVFGRKHLRGLVDSAGADDLITTLRVFLDSTNVRRCARTLDVHENTVRYRLARIEKLTGLDVLNDHSDRLKAELSLLMLRLLGEYGWEAGGSAARGDAG